MALTQQQIRTVRLAGKIIQLTDDRGLYIEIDPDGSKPWRFKYRHARQKHDDARRKLGNGVDPSMERKCTKMAARFNARNLFCDVAREYIEKTVAGGMSEATTARANWLLE